MRTGSPTLPTRALVLLAFLAATGCGGSDRAEADGGAAANSPGAPAAADDSSPSTALSLRAMTFNIRYGNANDGDNAWPLRRELLFKVIRDVHPDVLGMQEALRFQLDEIGAALDGYSEVGVGRDDGVEAGEYSAILFDSTRFSLEDSGTFWLSDTPEVPGSTSWGNGITRVCTWALLRERAGGASFYVFNTHWDHLSQPSRENSARLILERIAARATPDTPVLLTGDFNAGESNPAFRTLVEDTVVSLRDTFRALHPDAVDVGTFHGFEGGTDGDKIDAILASPEWQVLDAEIARVNDRGRYPSDHYPVTATLRLTPEGASGGAAR